MTIENKLASLKDFLVGASIPFRKFAENPLSENKLKPENQMQRYGRNIVYGTLLAGAALFVILGLKSCDGRKYLQNMLPEYHQRDNQI